MKNEHLITAIVSVLLAVTGLAIIAVIVSQKSNTGGVLSAGGGAFAQIICKALSPITGNQCGGSSSLTPVVTSTITF